MKIWTQIGILSLAALMLMRTLVIPVLCLDYEMRKEYIAKYHCVNKNKPQLHCNGKCYLAKRIAAAQEQEQRQAERDFFQKLLEVPASIEKQSFNFPTLATALPAEHHYEYLNHLLKGSLSGIFHPPSFV